MVQACYASIIYYSTIDKETVENPSAKSTMLRLQIDDIRSRPEYASKYEYASKNGLYKREYTIGNEDEVLFYLPFDCRYKVITN